MDGLGVWLSDVIGKYHALDFNLWVLLHVGCIFHTSGVSYKFTIQSSSLTLFTKYKQNKYVRVMMPGLSLIEKSSLLIPYCYKLDLIIILGHLESY